MIRQVVIVVGLWLLSSRPGFAQATIGARGYMTYGITTFAAADSFEAVSGKRTRSGWGGGGTVTNVWRDLFVDVALSSRTFEGERVFINSGTTYPLGIPMTVTLRPLDLAAGWRWRFTRGKVSPYAGGGISFVSYKETSDFSQTGDDVNEQKAGALVVGGVDVAIWKWIYVGGDLRYRAVSGVLGLGGVSEVFGNDQLGGFAAALRVSVGR
jgi:opacity protein-like surface antigen